MTHHPIRLALAAAATLGFASLTHAKTPDGKPLIVLIAGRPSHGPGEHEHNAGVQLLAKCLGQGAPKVATKFYLNAEWPSAADLAQADTIAIYSDGGGGHPAIQGDHLADLGREMKRGCGFVTLHYAVEPAYEKDNWPDDFKGPDGKPGFPPGRTSKGKGASEFLQWLGGYFEQYWSVNPHWTADFTALPVHPINNGVKPFSTNDEWYFYMRFRPGMKNVTPILSAIAPPETMNRGEGHHSGNPEVRRAVLEEKKPQHVAWAVEREDGGRGFGFTGGHFHKGWANDDQRKLVLNALLWTAKVEVPAAGVQSKVSEDDLAANLDPKQPRKPKSAAVNPTAEPVFSSPVVREEPVNIRVDLKGAKELYLAVTDAGDGFVADWADWIEPVLIKADGTKIKLTDLTPKAATVGFGKLGINKNAAGKAMRVGGKPVEFGFGAHAPSLVAFDLPEGVARFEAGGGIDSGGIDQKIGATVTFRIYTQNPGSKPLQSQQDVGTAAERYGLAAAKKSIAAFNTPDGLQASLVAAEPMIQNPTSIDIDPRGRIWATECVNYRKYMNLRPEGDRVVIMEDTDGDGLADRAKTFYQNKDLTNPLGICVLPQPKGNKVLVSAAPNVWLLTDADGDDIAEDAKVVFKIGGVWNYDHQVHAFTFGFDGKLYFNAGNSITELKWPDDTIVKDLAGNEVTASGKPYRQGMVYRCDIDLATGKASNVETLGWNFRNNYKAAIDSFGTLWQSDNDDDGNKGVRINYVMEYGNYGYQDEMTGAGWRTERTNLESEIPLRHWHQNDPGVVPNLLQTGGGSPTGIVVNESTALGPQFTNQVIHCDAGPRTVRAYPVEKDGAGYKATMTDILTSSDNWYRPSDVAIAPDGSLVISDWYDPGVGGHAMGDHEPGKIMGRIYRVAATGPAPKAPMMDVSTIEGAIAALQSPNRGTAYAGWQALHALGTKAQPALEKLAQHQNPRFRARALGVLSRIPGSATKALRTALNDSDADVRVAAVRLCNTLSRSKQLDTTPLDEDAALVGKMLRDRSPEVRRQVALSLRGTKEIAPLWAALAQQHDGKDRWYLEALGIGAGGNEDACFEAWLAAVGDQWNTPTGRDIVWRMRSTKAAAYLARILQDGKIAAPEKPRFLRAFDFLARTPEKEKALVQLAGLGGDMDGIELEALKRLNGSDLNSSADVKAALDRQIAAAKGSMRFVEIVRDFNLKGHAAALIEIGAAHLHDPLAADALKLALSEADFATALDAALAGPQADSVVSLLGTSSQPRILNTLTTMARNPGNPLPRRIAAVQALARSQSGAEAVLALARNNALAPDLKDSATAALNLVQYPALKTEIAALFPPPSALGGKPLPPIAELVKKKGNIARGKIVAERAESSCVTCHRIGEKGVDFAPALTEIGSKLPKEALFESIISPNNGVSMGFETTQLAMKDGTLAMGIVRSETEDEVVLALPGGVFNKFARRQIAKREKLPNSLMPSGLNQALTENDLIDLVEYLASLKKP